MKLPDVFPVCWFRSSASPRSFGSEVAGIYLCRSKGSSWTQSPRRGIAKISGQSYRLVARKSVVNGQTAQLPVIAACLNSALTMVGMYEAPANVPSDVFIEVAYGMDLSGRVDPSTRESFLKLSARANHARTIEAAHDEELWDIRVAIAGVAGRAGVGDAAALAGRRGLRGHRHESRDDHPGAAKFSAVAAVREGALKILDAKPAKGAPPAQEVGEAK